jgi:ClpP class serine protease
MNTALALEIYRGLWVVESGSSDSLKNILRDARMPGVIYDPKNRANAFSYRNISVGTAIGVSAPKGNSAGSKNKIAVTNINGVITKSGGPSSAGMEELSQEMINADNDPDVLGHLVRIDSPGGSAVGMKYMQKTMQSLTKPKVTFVPRQSIAASGGWGILSEGDYVMTESEDCEVGCHGVMWSVSGVPNGQKDGNGEVNFTVISVTSPNKNAAIESAINNNDTSLMQAEVNKLHLDFQASTKAARPNIKPEQMLGDMFPASQVVGTMIDAIGTEQQAIAKLIELSTAQKVIINKNKAMTAAELLAQHPTVHAEILAAGVSAEKDRVDTWMVYHDIDPEAVAKGIDSGKAVSGKEQAQFLVKATQGNVLNAIKRDSAGNIIPAEAATEATVEKTAKQLKDDAEFAAAFPKLVAKGITLEKFNATLKAN